MTGFIPGSLSHNVRSSKENVGHTPYFMHQILCESADFMAIQACNRFLQGNGSFSGLLRHVGQSVDCHKLVINLVVPEVGIGASSID